MLLLLLLLLLYFRIIVFSNLGILLCGVEDVDSGVGDGLPQGDKAHVGRARVGGARHRHRDGGAGPGKTAGWVPHRNPDCGGGGTRGPSAGAWGGTAKQVTSALGTRPLDCHNRKRVATVRRQGKGGEKQSWGRHYFIKAPLKT